MINEEEDINKQTYIGKNTPLHFAVIYENLEAVKLIVKCKNLNPELKNL